jgi:fatty-acyl-CoA synthase
MSFLKTIKDEINYVGAFLRIIKEVKSVDAKSNFGIADEIEMRVDKFGSNLAFLEDDINLTYDDMEKYANRIAAWALSEGCIAGDTVALFIRNRAHYVAVWFGLTKIGVIPALLNYQLAGPALAHCVNVSDSKIIIVDHEMADQWQSAKKHTKADVKVFSIFGNIKKYKNLDSELLNHSYRRPSRNFREGIKGGDLCMKMFTSGTTGMPKAAKVTHVRAQNYMRGFAGGVNTGQSDRIMMVLPLYHATGGLCGVGAALTRGGAVIVRPKFSVSNFWDEVVKYEATLLVYVGELCRFLLSSPVHPQEHKHKIKWIIGNGLRPEVWPGFVKRFNIKHVIEFYGATEGNVSLMNIDGPVGAVGRVPGYLKFKFNCDIIKYDIELGENIRNSKGFCVRTDNNEVGELIGEIKQSDPRFRFEGYETSEATQKKILRDVFKQGDAWFRTGDLLKRDKMGYYYFIDRVGDTFRWKAENVATGEVAAVLSSYNGINEANVYGVSVPGYDGRAGMASIVAENKLDMKFLMKHIQENLPSYARPVFIRLSKESETTGTFKFKKTDLVEAGFNPKNFDDPIYYSDLVTGEYRKITQKLFDDISNGVIRL